jgi:hypothetical protein
MCASVVSSGNSTDVILDFRIPAGPPGVSSTDAIFNFAIPAGANGSDGVNGFNGSNGFPDFVHEYDTYRMKQRPSDFDFVFPLSLQTLIFIISYAYIAFIVYRKMLKPNRKISLCDIIFDVSTILITPLIYITVLLATLIDILMQSFNVNQFYCEKPTQKPNRSAQIPFTSSDAIKNTEKRKEEEKKEGEIVEEPDDINLCAVCIDQKRKMVAIPCGHYNFCYSCVQSMTKQKNWTCPICRAVVNSYNVVHD